MIAIEPWVLDAQKTRAGEAKWMKLFTNAQDLGSEERFKEALAIVEKIEGLLSAPPKAKEPKQAVSAESAPTVSAAASEAKPAVARWNATLGPAVAGLQKEIEAGLDKDDPNYAEAVQELKTIQERLNAKLETREQVAEMESFLRQDQVVADICEVGFDLRGPLIEALAEFATQMPA